MFPAVNFLNMLLQKSCCFQLLLLRQMTFHKVV